ncbi:MAG: alpha/beta fold hydrolase [Actinomycetes bacterium]
MSTVQLVAVHGNGGGAARFARLPAELPHDVALHAPTLPGFGGRPLGDVDGVAGLAAALREEVVALPRPRVLLGHGIGGSVALELLSSEPDLVDGLVLHAPVGTRLDTRWFPRLLRPRWVRRAVQVGISSPVLRPLWRRTIVRDVPAPFDAQFLAAYADAEAFGAMFDWLTATWFDGLPVLPDLPATILWGEDDRVLGADQRADYRRLLPRADERTVPGWGHFPMLSDPHAYGEVVAGVARTLVRRASEPGTGREAS